MAKPTTLPASKFLVLLGDGGDPETFASPCGLTTKGLNNTAETTDIDVPDCDDPDAPFWKERAVVSLSSALSGSGIMAMESTKMWRDWFLSGESRNLKIKLDAPADKGGGHFEGKYVLTTFNLGAEGRGKCTTEIELQNDGALVWVDAV